MLRLSFFALLLPMWQFLIMEHHVMSVAGTEKGVGYTFAVVGFDWNQAMVQSSRAILSK